MSDYSAKSVRTAESRCEPRHATQKKLKIKRLVEPDNASQHMIELTDCSPSGIGFLSQVALAVGDKFTISIMLSTLSQLIYAVRHCRAADGARYMIGAEFMGFASSDADADRQLIFESLLRLE